MRTITASVCALAAVAALACDPSTKKTENPTAADPEPAGPPTDLASALDRATSVEEVGEATDTWVDEGGQVCEARAEGCAQRVNTLELALTMPSGATMKGTVKCIHRGCHAAGDEDGGGCSGATTEGCKAKKDDTCTEPKCEGASGCKVPVCEKESTVETDA